ncbi:MAG: hypothetical protein J1E58_07245 [Prevotella sp.]|nr:hypothetical protein [Prevotella sp.]
MAFYSKTIQEEELKNRIRQDWFKGYDNTGIPGKVDFYVGSETTPFLWAEAKRGVKRDIYEMFVQLILTIGKDRIYDKLDPPDYLGAMDAEKIGFVHYDEICEVFEKDDFNWQVPPSNHHTREFKLLYKLVYSQLKEHVFIFNFAQQGDSLRFFIRDRFSLTGRKAAHTSVNKNNFPHVYRKWRIEVKDTLAVCWDDFEKSGIYDCHFFLADLMSDKNTTLFENLTVLLQNDHYKVNTGQQQGSTPLFANIDFNDGQMAHRLFWERYRRPPREEYREYILERTDRLRPQNVRMYHGAYYTPLQWVEKAQEYLAMELGEDWQDNYYIWDCAAGTGNLLAGLTNRHNIWASTLELGDVDIMKERISNGFNMFENHVFQFDFLNDHLLDHTNMDGTFIQSKIPQQLQEIIRDEEKRKRLVIFINPPFKEAATATTVTGTGENATGVAVNSRIYKDYSSMWGIACRELFAQFMIRIYEQIPGCKIGQFSTLKIPIAPNFNDFRNRFFARAGRCFIVPAKTFDNVPSQFPIGFFVWHTDEHLPITEIIADVYDQNGELLSQKRLAPEQNGKSINDWIKTTRNREGENNIGYMACFGADFQHNNHNYIVNDKNQLPHPRGTWVTDKNIKEVAIYFAVRHSIERTWLNDRDQFLFPNDNWEADSEFHNDCLAFTLFSPYNNIRSAMGTNFWQPFTEEQLGLKKELSCHFMTDYIRQQIKPIKPKAVQASWTENKETFQQDTKPLVFSPEAQDVFKAALGLWRYYFQRPDADLNASYYDIREYFQGRNEKGNMKPASEDETYNRLHQALRIAHKKLSCKIMPKVYEYGFLK